MKKSLALLLTVLMLVGMFPVSVFATGAEGGENAVVSTETNEETTAQADESTTDATEDDGSQTEKKLPDATVSVLAPIVLTPEEHDYMVWPSGDDTIDRPLQIVMNFKANETQEQAAAGAYGEFVCDFYLTCTGLANGSIEADGCYLAGNYGSFGWIVIPTDDVVIEKGVSYPVVSGYDANLKYAQDICGSVKDFTAAIYIDEAILAANPDFQISLALKMTNPNDETDVLTIGEPAVYTVADLLKGAPIEIPDNIVETIVGEEATTEEKQTAEAIVTDIQNNAALLDKDYAPVSGHDDVDELVVTLTDVDIADAAPTKIVYSVAPMKGNDKVSTPSAAITFRLPIPSSVTKSYAKVYHEEELLGTYDILGEGSGKYVEVSSASFSEFAVEPMDANIEVTDAEGNVTYYGGFTGFSGLDLANCTIKLLANVSDANLILNKGDESNVLDTDVTLDLNGFTFSRTGSKSGAISLTQGAGLTILDSSEAKTGKILADTYAVWMMNGDLTVESGVIESTSTETPALYVNAANVALNGGEIIAAGDAVSIGDNFVESRGTSTVTISGGEIVAEGNGIVDGSYAQAETAVSVTSGKITAGGVALSMDTAKTEVSGGTFSSDVSDYCVEGFECKPNADGTYGVAAPVYVAKIGETGYETLAAALATANAMTGDVTVEIYGKVEYADATPNLTGAYGTINFVGKTDDAEISITRNGSNGYICGNANGTPNVTFTDLILSKPAGSYAGDAGFMNVYFTVYRAGTVTYTGCTFPDGACAAGGTVTYTSCNFANNTSGEYSLWVYANADVTVDGGSFTGVRGVKMYTESNTVEDASELTLNGVTFTDSVTQKPAIVLTYGESVTLENNTYSSTGVFELDSDGAPNGTTVTSDVAPTCVNDDGACGVLVDGAIYRNVTEAAAVATSGSTVTLLHNSTETVELAEGVKLNKNGFTADGVTVKQLAPSGSINGGLVNLQDANRTFLTIESYITYANESIVVKVYDANGNLLVTSSLVDNDRVILGKENWGGLSTMVGINCTDDWWNTVWEEGKLRADYVPAKATLYIDGVEMNTAVVQMRAAGTELAVDWEEVPGVPAAPAQYVAMIGEQGYATLGEALAAVEDGQTITLVQNVTTVANEFWELNGKKNVTITAADGVVINGDISIGYHASHIDGADRSASTLTVKNLTVNGTLTVLSNDAALVVASNKAAQITVKTYREGMDISVSDNTMDGSIGTAANSYGLFVVPNATGYDLAMTGNTFLNVNSHAAVVQGLGDGSAVTAANSITVENNVFASWGTGGKSNRAAFKIWADTKYAPAEGGLNDTTVAMRALVEAIAAGNNTFASTAGNTVHIDAYGAAGDCEDFPPSVTYVAQIGDVKYETVQAAINAAKDGDVVTIFAGEYGAINISNKNITIQGTVGDNGELLTTLTGNNPVITGHGFNGTIKDLKIGECWKVMYAEPAGNVTVDNVYVTGATYGFHLVAYSTGLTWTIQNSYMDLAWANSFGVYGNGDADIVIKGNTFEATKPYYPDYGSIHVNSFLPNVTVEENIFGENAKIYIDGSVTDTSNINISKNYHADGVENAFADDAEGVKVAIRQYYNAVDENGNLTELVELFKGTGTEADPYIINNIDDLKYFRDMVNAGTTYDNQFVKLNDDIDLNGEAWTPIGTKAAPFKGTFDGNDCTITNLVVAGENNVGFFGYADGCSIKNLKLNNVSVTGADCVGAIAGQVYSTSTIDNCHVSGSIKIEGQTNVGGIVGKYYVKVSNCSVIGDGAETSYIKGVYTKADLEGDNVGGIMGHGGESNNFVGNTVKNITISGTRKIGGIVGTTNRATNLDGCVVENVKIETTATAEYAAGNTSSMDLGGLIGHYYNSGNDGVITNVTVSNVAFETNGLADAGAIVGGDRGTPNAAPAGVTATNVTVSNVTGATQKYLLPAVAQIGEETYATLAEAIAAAQEGDTINILAGTIEEGTIKLPATLKNITFKGADDHASILKDMTIMASDGNSYSYVGLTFDGIAFDNSRLVFTGWRNGDEIIEDLTVTNCIVKNLDDTTNNAFLHINKDVSEPVNGLTFTNNVLDGLTGGSKSGIYTVNTGKVTITGNTFNNIVFRPALIQLADCDGLEDEIVISDNVFSNTTRLQVYGSEADDGLTPIGTDTLEIAITENVFQNISGYYICTWGINGDAEISKNYYDSEDLSGKIYWNNIKPTDEAGLYELGVYPVYTELNEDGTINEESAYTPVISYVAQVGEQKYTSLADAVAAVKANGGTLTLLADANESITFNYPAEGAPTEITFDLNGFTITSAESTLWVSDGYKVTVKDSSDAKTGKLISTNAGGEAIAITRNGHVVLESGYVYNDFCAVWMYNATENGTFVMNGGTLEVPNGGQTLSVGAGKATINGGKILCNKVIGGGGWNTLVYANGALEITGGEFLGTIGTNGGPISISGGTFSYCDDPNDGFRNEHLATGYSTKVNADGSITVYALPTSLSGSGTEEDPFLINNIDDLKFFRDSVNNGTRYNGQFVKLNADIDLNEEEWTPIGDRNVDQGSFLGTFDGGNHTISNLWISQWNKTGAGFFSKVGNQTEYVSGTVKNVTFNNVTIISNESYVGVIAQAPSGALIENVHVTGDINISGYGYVGGIVGHGYPTINNSSVIGDGNGTITANYWGAGAILGFSGDYGSHINNATVEGVKIHANYGGAASVTGSPYGAGINGATVKDVVITSNSDYCMGYVSAGGSVSNVTISNVTATANGQPITPADAVAAIGENVYFTLADAIAAAQDGDTIVLINNIDLTETVTISGKTLTLDLGEYTITDTSTTVLTSKDGVWALIDLKNNAKLTVQGNGTIDCNYKNVTGGWTGMAYAINVDSTSELTVNGGTFVNGNGGIQTLGTVTVNDGTFVPHNGGVGIMALYGAAKVTVNGGTFTDSVEDSDVYTGSGAVWSGFGATVEIKGGTFDFEADPSNNNVVWTLFPAQHAITEQTGFETNMTVSGGTFINFNPATDVIVDYSASTGLTFGSVVAEGYEVVENADGTYGIAVDPAYGKEAKIGDTYYATIAEAIAAAEAGDTVTILAGNYTTNVSVNKDITVIGETDAQGNNLVTINGQVSITGNGATVENLNIAVSVENKETALYINGGNILVKGCNVSGYNVTRYSYVQAGGVTFQNCDLDGYDYTLHFDSLRGDLTIDGCTLDDWSAIGAGGDVIVKNSTFKVGESEYNTLRTWTDATYTGCEFEKGFDLDLAGDAQTLKVENSTYTDGTPVDINLFRANDTENYTITVDNVVMSYAAKIGNTYYETFADALDALQAGDTLTLLADATISNPINVNGDLTIDGNGKTLTYTGTNRAIEIPMEATGANVTIKDLTIDASTAERGINYNTNGTLTVENVTVTSTTYAINFPTYADNATVSITDSKLTSSIALNIWGSDMTFTVTDSELYSVENDPNFSYATIQLNNDDANGHVAEGTTVTVEGGMLSATDENGNTSIAVSNWTSTGKVVISDTTEVNGEVKYAVATYGGASAYTLQDAIDEVIRMGYTCPIVLIRDIELTEGVTVPAGANITLDLNGKTIAGTDNNTSGNFYLIDNRGTLTITGNGKITLTASNDRDWNNSSVVIANNPGGKLVVENGTIEHLGGTDMAYAIDNLTNGKGTYAETVINGGTVKSTYRAVRQFLNGVEAQNILTINGGTIEGANKAIFFHDPSAKANTGTLTVGANADINGDVYLYVTPGSTEWPVEVSIASAALKGESTVVTGNVPEGYVVENNNGTWGVRTATYVAQVGETKYESLAEALTAAQDGETITLIWAEGDAPIAMNGAVYGNKTVTITGTATVDWSKGFLFIGRGGEGDGTVIFDNANLTSASNTASHGIHVSGREKNTTNKYDGTLVIKNSTIVLDYLINKGTMTLDNSTLTVKNGFSIGGRPASETESGEDATATLNLTNGSKVIVNSHNGMGLGYEAIGVMNIDQTSSFETTQSFLVTAKGTMNLAGTAKVAGTLTNNGSIVLTDKAATLTATECGNVTTNVADYKVVYENGAYKLVEKIYVAQIGEAKYESLAEAIAAAKAGEGDTIVLLKTIALTEDTTLDLTGLTVKTAETAAGEYVDAFTILANVTVKGGTIDARPSHGYTFYVGDKSGNAGELTIEDGTFYGETSVVNNRLGTVTIKGGIFEVSLENADDTYDYVINCIDENYKNGTAKFVITGGTFVGFNPEDNAAEGANTKFTADGYIGVSDGNGNYTVCEGEWVAQIGETKYESLQDALDAAAATGATVVVLNDVDMSRQRIYMDEGITLDLNGHTITAKGFVSFGEGGSIVDKGETKGLLAVPKGYLVMTKATYPMLPVWDTENAGYIFVEVEPQIVLKNQKDDGTALPATSFIAKFRPYIGASTIKMFKNGAADNGLEFCIVIHCVKAGEETEALMFNIKDTLIQSIYENSQMIALTVNGASDIFDEYVIEVVITSETGVSYSSLNDANVPKVSFTPVTTDVQ